MIRWYWQEIKFRHIGCLLTSVVGNMEHIRRGEPVRLVTRIAVFSFLKEGISEENTAFGRRRTFPPICRYYFLGPRVVLSAYFCLITSHEGENKALQAVYSWSLPLRAQSTWMTNQGFISSVSVNYPFFGFTWALSLRFPPPTPPTPFSLANSYLPSLHSYFPPFPLLITLKRWTYITQIFPFEK